MTVAIGRSSIPSKVIAKGYLRAKGPFGFSMDPRPKRHPKILRKEKSKEMRDFMKVEKGGVHLCTKQ
jgi:hypothetical protein